MGIRYQIDKAKGITFELYEGPISAEEYFEHILKMAADPDWPGHRNIQLVDMRKRSLDKLIDKASLDKAADIIINLWSKPAKLKVIIVATDAYMSSSALKHLMFKFPLRVTVFNNLTIACDFLDIDLEETEQILSHLKAGPCDEAYKAVS
jgi:hypothetical protein